MKAHNNKKKQKDYKTDFKKRKLNLSGAYKTQNRSYCLRLLKY